VNSCGVSSPLLDEKSGAGIFISTLGRAVETWLLQEGIIAIEKGGSVTPNPSFLVS